MCAERQRECEQREETRDGGLDGMKEETRIVEVGTLKLAGTGRNSRSSVVAAGVGRDAMLQRNGTDKEHSPAGPPQEQALPYTQAPTWPLLAETHAT
jgi:hypothetical protein